MQDTSGSADREAVSSERFLSDGRLRKELLIFGLMLFVGLVLLPMAIFETGQVLLGEYSDDGTGLGHLYGVLLKDLSKGRAAAWLLVLGPWLGVQLIRILWLPLSSSVSGGQSKPE